MGTFVVKHPKRDLWCEVKTDWTDPPIARDKVVTKVLDDQRGAQLPRHDGERPTGLSCAGTAATTCPLADVYVEERPCNLIP